MRKKTIEIDIELYSVLDDGMDLLRAIVAREDDDRRRELLTKAKRVGRRYEKYLDRKFKLRRPV